MKLKAAWSVAALSLTVFGISGVCTHAAAADAPSAPVSTKRQISECMSRRMATSRTLSYNDASRLCKEQIKAQAAATAVSPAGKAVAAH